MTYTFDLRQNITFQDGTAFNATAVVFSLERAVIMNDPNTPAWMLGPIKGAAALMNKMNAGTANQSDVDAWTASNPVEALSNYVVAIHLDHPYAPLPLVLAFSVCSIVSPTYVMANGGVHMLTSSQNNHNTVMDTTAQAGTGPYIMNASESTPQYVILTPNPHYWGGPSGTRMAADTIVIKVVTDAGTRLLDLQSGNTNIADISRANWYTLINQTLWENNGIVQSVYPGVAAYGPNYTFDLDFFGFNVRF
jgi:peptide/nickel transport system substrate-binding protein